MRRTTSRSRRFASAKSDSRQPRSRSRPISRTLYVALGGVNAVAVYDVTRRRRRSRDSFRRRGIRRASTRAPTDDTSRSVRCSVRAPATGTLHGQRGALRVRDARSGERHSGAERAELVAYHDGGGENDKLALASSAVAAPRSRRRAPARAVPERPGDPSLINHVVFIVRENRTYDQVLGDLDRGARDSSLVMYGRDVTPNTHALSRAVRHARPLLRLGGNSADGHQWLTQANETEYPMWPLYYGRSYPSEGEDALTYSSGGFLWEAARAKGKTVAVFGEYAPSPQDVVATACDAECSRSTTSGRTTSRFIATC